MAEKMKQVIKREDGFSFLEVLLYVCLVALVIAIPALGLAESMSGAILRIVDRVAGIGIF